MARTKQTARKTVASKPFHHQVAIKEPKVRAPIIGGVKRPHRYR